MQRCGFHYFCLTHFCSRSSRYTETETDYSSPMLNLLQHIEQNDNLKSSDKRTLLESDSVLVEEVRAGLQVYENLKFSARNINVFRIW